MPPEPVVPVHDLPGTGEEVALVPPVGDVSGTSYVEGDGGLPAVDLPGLPGASGTRERARVHVLHRDGSQDPVRALSQRDRVVQQLLLKGLVSERQVRLAVEEWKRLRAEGVKTPLWRVLTSNPEVNREQIYGIAAQVYAFEEIHLHEEDTLNFLKRIRDEFDEEHWDQMIELFVLPVAQEKEPYRGELRWIFATNDPARPEVNHLVQQLGLKRFELRYAPESVIATLITEAFLGKNEFLERLNEDPMAYDLGMSYEDQEGGLIDEEALEAEISRSSLINLFEAALVDAVHQGASDIHIFPNADRQIEIHFRVDGELKRWHTEERIHPEAFLAVVKDNSVNVDRFDRDIAQDGFIQRWIDGALIRFRVSVLPIASAAQEIRAESIVIRVLDDRKVLTDLRQLGLLDVALQRFNAAIREPHGMVILTGPTGSGKSTTLVAALHQVVSPKVNVLTVEDPVEYIIKGVRQIKLSHRLDLEGALRAILRHDPDVVMVGEMRDRATAELAIK
ncbi:MAG: type II/IV secretion system protein, partial [Bacteroidetes bacterium]